MRSGLAARLRAGVLLIGVLGLARAAFGQGAAPKASPPELTVQAGPFRPQIILASSTQVVPLAVVVRDAQGQVIDNLTRDDFEVLDHGAPQTLASFLVERHSAAVSAGPSAAAAGPAAPAAPRTVAFFFDDLNSSFFFGNLQHARQVALTFLQAGLAPGEQVGIFTASGEHEVAFTSDTAALEQAVAAIQPVERIPRPCTLRFWRDEDDLPQWPRFGMNILDSGTEIQYAGFHEADHHPSASDSALCRSRQLPRIHGCASLARWSGEVSDVRQ